MTAAASSGEAGRLFALLGWHPAVGLAICPVGVLAVAPGAGQPWYVTWIGPPGWPPAATWRERLSRPGAPGGLAGWIAGGGTAQMEELPAPGAGVPLDGAAEAAADILLAEVLPWLPPVTGGT